ncbi:MAG: AAA family ATPase [Lachnospiraceae bacterium]|nr:AAA family ATPase [Lachnospiraceae bacterium]
MSKVKYQADSLLLMGRQNYEKLVKYCENLEKNGFWEQARQVMKQSSTDVLDRYVQSVLMNLAVHCGELLENQKEYISLITNTNPLEIHGGEDVPQKTIDDSARFCDFPPILLQLCGVYDKDFRKNTGEEFLDAFLNILLCMTYLNDGKDKEVNDFIRKYYTKICLFLDEHQTWNHEGYLFHKLHGGDITNGVRWLHVKEEKPNKTIAVGGVEIQKPPKQSKKDKPAKKKTDANAEDEEPKLPEPAESAEEKEENQKETNKKNKEEAEKKKQETEKKKREAEKKRLAEEKKREEEERLAAQREQELAREQFQLVKKRIQEREERLRKEAEERLQKLVDELDALVGLQGVKQEIQSLINLIRIRKLRESMNMPTMDMSYHMVFTGSPGTGKTTVARLVSRIYKELGILSEGTVIETDRSGLVAGYVGQTAIKVHELVEQAIGGVLFIDEAYSLVNPDVPNDFGMEAVDTLVKLMEDHRDNLVIIVAGYTREMKTFLKSNTGLVSRFNKFIDFPDYSDAELLDILDVMAENAGLTLEKTARRAAGNYLKKLDEEAKKDFGNARGIRNLFEKVVMNQANRLIQMDNPSKKDLMTICKQDVDAV